MKKVGKKTEYFHILGYLLELIIKKTGDFNFFLLRSGEFGPFSP
jgi:hypothetical protein